MRKRLIFISIILSLSAFSCSKKAENADNFLVSTISFESYSSGKITILNENSLKINDICKIEVIPNQGYYLSDLFISTNEKISFIVCFLVANYLLIRYNLKDERNKG